MWQKQQKEYYDSFQYLGMERDGILGGRVEGIGDGSVTGETRGVILECLETPRAQVLTMALSQLRPRSTRAAWSWRQRDKISTAWLLALPSVDTNLTNAEFSEAAAASLCLPSPACSGRIGETIRGRVSIDKYGDNIQSTPLPGDHWRICHNYILHLLHRLCLWAGIPVEFEVLNLFWSD